MSNKMSSKDRWESIDRMSRAETDAARAQAQGISTVELASRDEAARLASLPDPVISEEQHLAQLAQDMADQRADVGQERAHSVDRDIGIGDE
jgi:hypothetical protein